MSNVTFCKHHTNCQNIDNHLYFCPSCNKYKAPNTIYDSWGSKTPITLKAIFYTFINLFINRKYE